MISPIDNGNTPASTMTKREMMAKDILVGVLANPVNARSTGEDAVIFSIQTADGLLAELVKPQEMEP